MIPFALGLKLLDILNSCLINNKRDEFILTLSNHIDSFQSEDIDADYAGSLYFVEFKYIYDEKENPLGIDDYKHGIKVLNVVVDINKAIDIAASNIEKNKSECLEYDSGWIMSKIRHPNAHLQELIIENLRLKYLYSFVAAKQFKNSNSKCLALLQGDREITERTVEHRVIKRIFLERMLVKWISLNSWSPLPPSTI